MRSLQELIEANGIKMTPVYVHSVPGETEGGLDYDVFDCFFTLEAEVSLYGGRFNARTLLVRDFGQSPALSRRANGDGLTPPSTSEVLEQVIFDAVGVENSEDWRDWACEYVCGMSYDSGAAGFLDGLHAYDRYEVAARALEELKVFLNAEFEQFKNAVINGEG